MEALRCLQDEDRRRSLHLDTGTAMDLPHRPHPPAVVHIRCHNFDREMEALLDRHRGKAMTTIRRRCQDTGTLLALRHLHLDMATVAVLHRQTLVLLRLRRIE